MGASWRGYISGIRRRTLAPDKERAPRRERRGEKEGKAHKRERRGDKEREERRERNRRANSHAHGAVCAASLQSGAPSLAKLRAFAAPLACARTFFFHFQKVAGSRLDRLCAEMIL